MSTSEAPATVAAETKDDDVPNERAYWRKPLARYTQPRVWRSLLDLALAVPPYLALSALMVVTFGHVSYFVTLAIAIPTGGFLLRTYILFHDCTHGSLMPTKRANVMLGIPLGLMVLAPFSRWRHDHAVHHATAGDLDRRGVGDIITLTVDEYEALDRKGRVAYRIKRNPVVMFGIGPIVAMMIGPRIWTKAQRPRMRHSVMLTDVALAVIVLALGFSLGWERFVLVWMPPAMLAGSAGIWLFYVQHQFEDAYWENTGGWSYADAALRGSSYLKLPKILQFFTGNIGLHHVHHLSARIPNYNLQRAHDENPIFHDVPVLTMRDGIRSMRLKLWDGRTGRLVTFRQARESMAVPPAGALAPAGVDA